jgi:hypothetical protein
MHNFYPEGHPQLNAALDKCNLLIKKNLEGRGEIKWRIDQKGFYDAKGLLAQGNQDVAALAKKFFYRRIKEVAFTPAMEMKDLRTLLGALKLEPEELQERGGVEAFFAESDTTGILLNELRYEDIKKLQTDIEEKKRAADEDLAEEKSDKAASGESHESGEEEVRIGGSADTGPEEELGALIERLRRETDFLKYNDLSVRVRERCDSLLRERMFAEIMPVLFVFLEHSSEASTLQGDIKATASERLNSLLNADMIQYLVRRVGLKEERYRLAIQRILTGGGEEAVERLLDAVATAPEAIIRRHYYNTLVPFGPWIRPLVEKRLVSPDWFVVRQMVSILGELGDPLSLDALDGVYRRSEVRVRKQVLKSLVKIRSPRSTAMIVNALGEEEDVLVNQAIISLAMLKDAASIEALGAIAVKREAFSERYDTQKEAIKALGTIGDGKAVPYLRKVLLRKVWFGRKANEEVRSLAAVSLGMIGTAKAREAITEACKGSNGELYATCRRILDSKERGA